MQRRADIFIAYAGPDHAEAGALHDAIEERGLVPWLDKRRLVPGDRWDEVINHAADEARLFAVIISARWSANWYTSDELARAIARARERDLRIVPVLLDDLRPHERPSGTATLVEINAVDRN